MLGKPPSKIMPRLFHGGAGVLKEKEFFINNNITHVVSLGHYTPNKNIIDPPLEVLHVVIDDLSGQDILSHIADSVKFIHKHRITGYNVYVHCQMGISRSSTIVCAYLMSYFNLEVQEALKFVKSKRKCADPNHGFIQQLHQFNGDIDEKEKLYNEFKIKYKPEDFLCVREDWEIQLPIIKTGRVQTTRQHISSTVMTKEHVRAWFSDVGAEIFSEFAYLQGIDGTALTFTRISYWREVNKYLPVNFEAELKQLLSHGYMADLSSTEKWKWNQMSYGRWINVYKVKRITFKPIRFGLTFKRNIVIKVTKNRQADKLGVHPGWRVIAINGIIQQYDETLIEQAIQKAIKTKNVSTFLFDMGWKIGERVEAEFSGVWKKARVVRFGFDNSAYGVDFDDFPRTRGKNIYQIRSPKITHRSANIEQFATS